MGGNMSTQNAGAQRRERHRGGHSRHHDRHTAHGTSSHGHHGSSLEASHRESSAHSGSSRVSRQSSHHNSSNRHTGRHAAYAPHGHEGSGFTGPPTCASEPTEDRSFEAEYQFQTLERWGYTVQDDGVGGFRIVNVPRTDGAWPHLVAWVYVSDENTLGIKEIDTANQPGRRRPYAANILLALWAGTGRSVSSLRAVLFQNVVEEGMFSEIIPYVYAALGEPEIHVGSMWIVGPEQGHLFDYVAQESRLAKIAAFMLRCRELRRTGMGIERFEFLPFATHGGIVACEQFRVIFTSHS